MNLEEIANNLHFFGCLLAGSIFWINSLLEVFAHETYVRMYPCITSTFYKNKQFLFFFDTGLFSCGVNRHGARFSEDWTGIFNIFLLPRRNIIALLVKAKPFIFEIQKNNIMESLYFYWNLWILIICAIEGLNFLEGLRTKLPTSLLQCM